MSEVMPVEEATKIAELQREETLSPEVELSELLSHIDQAKDSHQQLNLSRETVLRILDLFSKRESHTDDERKFIRQMVTDLSNELKDSKFAQAGISVVFAFVGGSLGILGGIEVMAPLAGAGQMTQGFGAAFDHYTNSTQVWMEVGKQLRMNDMSQADSLNEKIHKGMDRIMQAVEGQDATIQRARTK